MDEFKDKRIILLIGESGTGKTTVANILEEKYGLKSIESYTTREPRYPGENGHTFVSLDEIIALDEVCAYTFFDGNQYCATKQQIDDCDMYVVDLIGLASFIDEYRHYYGGEKIPIVFYLSGDKAVLKDRMRRRGDSEEQIEQRMKNDEDNFKNSGEIISDVCEQSEFPWFNISTTDDDSPNNAEEIADNIYKLSHKRHFNITNNNYDTGGFVNGVKKGNRY